MDLKIGDKIVFDKDGMIFREQGIEGHTDPHDQQSIDIAFKREVYLPHRVLPLRRALLCTEAVIKMDTDSLGLVTLRSTWARLGLISPPTVVDPGFSGTLTMEVFNASQRGIWIKPGDIIWNLITMGKRDYPVYQGRYQGQTGIQIPKAL
tara:strand:- start:978 stop:1427 length:450 start_codon:yes stop_codon:yes gene_type:complete